MAETTKSSKPIVCDGPEFWPDIKKKKPKAHAILKNETIFWAKPPKKKLERQFCADCALTLGLAQASEVLNAKLRDW